MLKKISNLLLLATIMALTGSWKNNETAVEIKNTKFTENTLQYFKIDMKSGGYIIVKAKESQMKGNFTKLTQNELNEMKGAVLTFGITDFIPGTIHNCFNDGGYFSASYDESSQVTTINFNGASVQGTTEIFFQYSTAESAVIHTSLYAITQCIPSGDIYWEYL